MTRDEVLDLARVAGFEEQDDAEKIIKLATYVRRTQTARILQIVERTDTPERRYIATQIRSMA